MLSDPKIVIYCDGKDCEEEESFGLTRTARGWDDRGLTTEIKAAGWTEINDNTHLCPQCTSEAKGK